MEFCNICNDPVPQGWDRRFTRDFRGDETIFFCSVKCGEKWDQQYYEWQVKEEKAGR